MINNFINKIKLNNQKKKKILILKKINKNEINIIKILIKLNIIKYLIKIKNKIILYIKFYKNEKLLFKLKNLYKPSNYKNVKYKNLKKLNKKNIILIISSNKGLINNYNLNKKTGGIILLQI